MKNKLLYVVVVVLCILPILSLAETSTSTVGKTIKDELEAKKETAKTSTQNIKQTPVDKIIEKVNQFLDIIINRYEAANSRLEKLANRIDSRIAKMKEKGVDTSEAEKLMAVAETEIKTAEVSTTDFTSTVSGTSFGTTVAEVKQNFATIKTQMEETKSKIKEAHATMVDVINNLKPGDNKIKN